MGRAEARRLAAALAALLAGVSAGAGAARDLFVDNLAGYTIEGAVLDAPNCAGPAFDDPSLEAFEQGLCLFHRPDRGPADTARAVSLLDQAQLRGLPPVHQQIATLMTGLAHCAEAGRRLAALRAGGGDPLERTWFCRDRRLALAELAAVRWDHALFDYADGLAPGRRIEARIAEMSACHAGPLSPDLDAECGLLTTIPDTEIAAFADGAADAVIAAYFTGVESPVTAMFARKHGRAAGLVESAEAAIAEVAAAAGAVNGEYEALDAAYAAARDAKMAPLYEAYRDAILRATAILDEFDRWKNGLFLTVENVDLLPRIGERRAEIGEELDRAAERRFAEKAEALTASVLLVLDGERRDRETLGELCRIYYCELASRRAMPTLIRACRRPALADNPLCVGQDGRPRDETLRVDFEDAGAIGVAELCRAAGVDPAFTVVDLAPAVAGACLGGLR